jgi:hypothetical protein
MIPEMNICARNKLLVLLERKGIYIEELEEAIENAYQNYCDRRDREEGVIEDEHQRKKRLLSLLREEVYSHPMWAVNEC